MVLYKSQNDEDFEVDEMQKGTSTNITDAYAFPDIAQQKLPSF